MPDYHRVTINRTERNAYIPFGKLAGLEYVYSFLAFSASVTSKKEIKQHEKRTIRRLKSANSGLYDYYVKNMGVAYANLYIKSLLWVDAIAFDQDVQDAYDAINNNK